MILSNKEKRKEITKHIAHWASLPDGLNKTVVINTATHGIN